MNEYPKRDEHHAVTYWTGPVGAPGTKVTGWKKYDGARVTYYAVTCTCKPYGRVSEELTSGYGFADVADQLQSLAYEHAASHVLND